MTSIRGLRLATAVLIAVACTMVAGSAWSDAAPRKTPLTGTWRYDPAKSVFSGANPYKTAMASFTPVKEGTKVVIDIVEGRDIRLHIEYVDPEDGTVVPVVGNPFYDSESTVWVAKNVARRTERRGGKVTGETTMTVAVDGRSYVATSSRTRPDGKLYTNKIHWDRISP